MLPKAKVGIPELNLPPMDPFVVDKANYQFTTNSLQGKVGVRNLKIVGLSDTTFESIDFKKNGDNITYQMKTKTPKIVIDGKYKAEININDNKMNAKGDFNVTMSKYSKLSARIINKENESCFYLTKQLILRPLS